MTRQVRGAKDNGRKTEDGRKSAPNASGRKALIDRLNHDLAREYEAILMYTHYLAELTGPCRGEVRAQFQAEIADKQSHAQFLADKVAALGGKPTTQPRPVPSADQPRRTRSRTRPDTRRRSNASSPAGTNSTWNGPGTRTAGKTTAVNDRIARRAV
jgi:hypothetical protein